MNNSVRLAILILGLLLAPVLFVFGTMTFNSLMTLGGPIVSIGLGIFFWRGRSKGHEMNNSLRLAILIRGLLLASVLFFFGALTMTDASGDIAISTRSPEGVPPSVPPFGG